MQYEWKPGAHHPAKMDPQIVGQQLEKLERKYGQLKAEHVVEAARKPNHPLHRVFQWDDTAAATQWRLWQARHLIGSVVAVQVIKNEETDEERTLSVRAFVNVKGGDERYYQGIVAAMSDEDIRNQVVSRALAELVAFKRKYQDLDELANIYAAIDELQGNVDVEVEEETVSTLVTTSVTAE